MSRSHDASFESEGSERHPAGVRLRMPLRVAPRALVALTLIACGRPSPTPTTIPPEERDVASSPSTTDDDADVPDEPDETNDDEASPPTPLSLACGRATAELHGDFAVLLDEAQLCINPGYPMDIEADGIGGGESSHPVRRDDCELSLRAWEPAPRSGAVAPLTSSDRRRIRRVPTPEGTAVELSVSVERAGDRAACEASAASLLQAVSDSVRVRPLRDETTTARADISSGGHGITVELPPGFWLVSVGGAADQWETAYDLRGPGEAFVSIYTAWSMDQGVGRTFEARVLPPRPRWGRAPDPWDSWDDDGDPESAERQCQTTRALGPEPRVETTIYVCGPAAEREPLLRVLRAMRFTPARSE